MTTQNENIILALDVETGEEAMSWVSRMKPFVRWFKVGHQLFLAEGPALLDKLHRAGARVFLDLKFYDIPATVSLAGIEATRLGVAMFNVHAIGGKEMMKSCLEASGDFAAQKGIPVPKILAVTLLTSHSKAMVEFEMGLSGPLVFHSIRLAKLAREAGMAGIISSAMELPIICKEFGKSFIYVVPGIRPSWSGRDDQKRVETPKEAIAHGADFLVIGRPVLKAADPELAMQKIILELNATG